MNSAEASRARARDKYDAIGPNEAGKMLGQVTINNHAASVWSFTELLQGDYRRSDYRKAGLSLVVFRQFDCVLETTKDLVLARHVELEYRVDNFEPVLAATAGEQFRNTSSLTTPLQLAVSPR